MKDIFAYGKAPSGDGTAFLNVEAAVHCHEADLESWQSSAFGLDVKPDLQGTGSYLLPTTVIVLLVAVLGVFILIWKRR